MKKMIYLAVLLCFPLILQAQQSEIFAKHIRTLQVVVNDDWLAPPIVALGGGNKIEISFDDMTHEYHRYLYKIEHCAADWKPSTELFYTDYIEGFNENEIVDYETSFNTTVLYTHYSLTLPNEQAKLRLSGNYKVSVYKDESGEDSETPVLTACFSIVEPMFGLSAKVSTNTEIDFNQAHQQLEYTLTYNGLTVPNPTSMLKTVVLQNRRWESAVWNPKPNYQTGNSLQYLHNRSLIFGGGNEYRKFEMLNTRYPTLNVDNITWIDPCYHAELVQDRVRKNYIYDEDKNGLFVVRNDNDEASNTTSDYLFVHFALQVEEEFLDAEVYLFGNFTYGQYLPEYCMNYNPMTKQYEAALLLKQGYYNYQYTLRSTVDNRTNPVRIEGDYYQTENEYMILVYYRQPGSRYDRLAAYNKISFTVTR